MTKKISTFPRLAAAAAVTSAWMIAGASFAAQANAQPRPDLSGHWQLNRDLSEDAFVKLLAIMGSGGGHHGGGGHGQGAEEIHNFLVNAPTSFAITQKDEAVVLTESNGHVRTLPTNDRAVKIDGHEVRTKWENKRLVSETELGNTKLVESYERSPDSQHLIVTAEMEVHGKQVSVRRVYDPVRK
jgi:hypothetical protein